jgi:peptidoglycan/xylan/chitin deacetylase (PgdA/CDA1 family)
MFGMDLKTKITIFFSVILSLILIGCFLYCFNFSVTLQGVPEGYTVNMEYGEDPDYPEITAVRTGKYFMKDAVVIPVEHSELSSTDIGTYYITYKASYQFFRAEAEITVNIVDTTPPVITFTDDPMVYSCYDVHDGDLTSSVLVYEDTYYYYYKVKDFYGNKTVEQIEKDNTIKADEEAPVITLGGNLATYSCIDDVDGDITSKVTMTEKGGVLYYTVKDNADRETTVSKTISGSSNKVIYLTYEGGPGAYTKELLSVLSDYGVKATFFVSGSSSYKKLISTIANAGHTVGVTSYSTDYSTVYASANAFVEDLNQSLDTVYAKTGKYSSIIRFLGGSGNTEAAKYKKNIMTTLINSYTSSGYIYQDWNVDSGDSETTDTSSIIQNIKSGISTYNISVVRMTDLNESCVSVTKEIIEWGQKNGYVFLPMTEKSTTIHQTVN